jgi:mannopine transport system permease protein
MSIDHSEFVTSGRSEAARYSLRLSVLLVAPLVLLLGSAFFYPLLRLMSQSLFAPTFTLEHYERLVSEALFIRVFWRTLRIAVTCVVLALVFGYPVSLALARASPRWRLLLLGCVFVPLWTSVLARSYAWVILLQRHGVVNDLLINSGFIDQPLRLLYNEGAMLVAMVHILLPFMILPIYNSLIGIPPELGRAARNLGAGPWKAFVNVTLPLSLPGVFAGSLMVFILAMGFYVAPAIVGGASTLVLSTLIGQQMTVQLNWALAGALCTVLLVFMLTLATVFRRFLVLGQRGV